MKKLFLARAILLFLISTAYAQAGQVRFSGLATVAPGGDMSLCETRYGDGYATSDHKSGVKAHKVSDEGHFIHILKSNVTFHHDV